ncbi:MAG: peptidoglycan DD-metalloendopeptidase family protein [Candidatus Saccharibacteria bacterium]|nr:peptidoglycan DD-metalloendopeptidase family protein [Candidatus Saccharibacteria bacterium]
MTTLTTEIMPELFSRSEILIWNFSDITPGDAHKDIQRYMDEQEQNGHDPRDAFHRQAFNEQVFDRIESRYLIGRYAEDRSDILRGSHMAEEGRTYHLAMDIFSRDFEPVFAPCDGEIVRSEYEPGLNNYGNYVIIRPDDASLPYIFMGHLDSTRLPVGRVSARQTIAHLGTFENLENGGWSVHVHLQLLTVLPPEGESPIGYSSLADLEANKQRFPDPQALFPQWNITR